MSQKITKLAIVEDQADMQTFLLEAFKEMPDFDCTCIYKNAEEAITFLPKSDAQIVIVDIGLPGESGIECVRKVKALRPDIHFMMYTIFDRDNKIFESLKAGASGYLLKSPNSGRVVYAVRELVNGGAPMSPSIARKVIASFSQGQPSNFQELDLLSKRELEILQLLSKGLLYKEIAANTNITEGTVKQHIHRIYQKLHVQNKTEAINKYLGRRVD